MRRAARNETATAEYSGGSLAYSSFGHDQVIQVVTGSVCCFYGNGFIPLKATILQQDRSGDLRLFVSAATDRNGDAAVFMDAPTEGKGVLIAGAVFVQCEVHGNGLIVRFFVFPVSCIVRNRWDIYVGVWLGSGLGILRLIRIVHAAGAQRKDHANR